MPRNATARIRQRIPYFSHSGKNLGLAIAFSERGIICALAFDNPSEG
jgi:hypothetical protein